MFVINTLKKLEKDSPIFLKYKHYRASPFLAILKVYDFLGQPSYVICEISNMFKPNSIGRELGKEMQPKYTGVQSANCAPEHGLRFTHNDANEISMLLSVKKLLIWV